MTLTEQQQFVAHLQKEIDGICKGKNLTALQQSAFAFIIAYYTGMRPAEIAALQMGDINFIDHEIKVNGTLTRGSEYKTVVGSQKTKNSFRTIYMPPIVEHSLMVYLEIYSKTEKHAPIKQEYENFIFLSLRSGTLLEVASLNFSFKKTLGNTVSDSKICQYMLRHTFATNCYQYGIRDNTISSILGHSKNGIILVF